jgi:hypothetical protein
MTGLIMKYFVLKPEGDDDHAIASRRAMTAYAKWIEATNPQLASEIIEWVSRESAASFERKPFGG